MPSITIPTDKPTAPTVNTGGSTPTNEELLSFIRQMKEKGIDFNSLKGQTRYILSIVPWELQWGPQYHGGRRKTYTIPAAKPGGYEVLPVTDTFTHITNTNQSSEEIASNGNVTEFIERPISADSIVQNALQYWVGDHSSNRSGHFLGVMKIAGPVPTQVELDKCRSMHSSCLRYMVQEADALQTQGKPNLIRPEHHRALENLSGEDVAKHPWHVTMGAVANVPGGCPRCTKPLSSQASVCPECHTDLAFYYLDRPHLTCDPKIMPAVHAELEFQRGKLKTKETTK